MTKLPTHSHDDNRCIHLFDTMPAQLLVARGPVERLNFQPRFTAPPCPVIASRRANILTLSVNVLTPLKFDPKGYAIGCRGYREHRRGTWNFILECFDDQRLLATLV